MYFPEMLWRYPGDTFKEMVEWMVYVFVCSPYMQSLCASERWHCWYDHLTTALACCGVIAAANISMIEAANTMVSNVIVAILNMIVLSHHCYYDQVYWLGAAISMYFIIGYFYRTS